MTVLATHNLSIAYAENDTPIINDVSLTFNPGTFNLLIGPSGSGKSTLLKALAGLYPEFGGFLSGQVTLDSVDLTTLSTIERVQKIALLFQNPNEQFAMKTPFSELVFTLENLRTPANEIKARAEAALAFVGIEALRDQDLQTLSGGEAQKVALAICLVMQSDIILLDEPFASVDPTARLALLAKLKQLQQQGCTIIISDHDLAGYDDLITDMYTIEDQRLVVVPDPASRFAAFSQPTATYSLPTTPANFKLQQVLLKTGNRTLLAPTDLMIAQGKFTLITGPNGVGKSTFFAALTRLKAYQGQITYLDTDIKKLKVPKYAQEVALVFQNAEQQYLKMTVAEEIALSRQHAHHPEFWHDEQIQKTLASLNLTGLEEHVVYQLSGGQKKKLQILIMLIIGTPVLLFDEPLAGLDIISVTAVMDLLTHIAAEQNQTIMMISHQLAGVTHYFNHHLVFANQHLVYEVK